MQIADRSKGRGHNKIGSEQERQHAVCYCALNSINQGNRTAGSTLPLPNLGLKAQLPASEKKPVCPASFLCIAIISDEEHARFN